MARFLSRTLLRHSPPSFLPFRSSPSIIPTSLSLCFHRHRSSKAQLLEVDLDSSSSSSSDGGGEVEHISVKKLDEMIHRLFVQRSTPDWLPFIPGSSFWVPPHGHPLSISELLGKLSNQLSEEESLSLITVRGWPCSAFFVEETTSAHLEKVDVEVSVAKEEGVEVKVEVYPENTSQPDDEEG